jgi:hypothetical protein
MRQVISMLPKVTKSRFQFNLLGVFFGGRQAQIFPKTPTYIPKLKEVVKNMETGQAFTRF